MTTEVIAQAIGAGATITFGPGRIFYIKTAAAALTVIAEKVGVGAIIRKFINVGAGLKFKADPGTPGWDYLRVTSASAQNLEFIIGDDDVDVANAVTITGAATVVDLPSASLADTPDNAQASGTQTVIAANLSRRRITIGVLSTALNSVRVSQAGGAGRGSEIQPGTKDEWRTTAALTVRNDNTLGGGGTATWYAEEET